MIRQHLSRLKHIGGLCEVPDMHPFVEAVEGWCDEATKMLCDLAADANEREAAR